MSIGKDHYAVKWMNVETILKKKNEYSVNAKMSRYVGKNKYEEIRHI